MLQNRAIKQVKVQWKHIGPDEAIWEMADQMWAMYPCFPFEAKQFWYGVLVYVLVYFLVHVLVMFGICTYVYGCKYYHELCYKSPISSMGDMSL